MRSLFKIYSYTEYPNKEVVQYGQNITSGQLL